MNRSTGLDCFFLIKISPNKTTIFRFLKPFFLYFLLSAICVLKIERILKKLFQNEVSVRKRFAFFVIRLKLEHIKNVKKKTLFALEKKS